MDDQRGGVERVAQTALDRMTGAVQDWLDEQFGAGHIVTDWIVFAREIEPDGKASSVTITSEDLDRIVAYGLASVAEEEVRDMYEDDDE